MDVVVLAFVLLASLFIVFSRQFRSRRRQNLPPGPPPWPLIGNVPLLRSASSSTHRAFALLSQQYGPIFFLRLGSQPAIVVSSASLAKQVLQIHDHNFSNRPPLRMCKLLLYGQTNGLLFASNDANWREFRKLINLELLNQKQVQEFLPIRHEEVACMIEFIERHSRKADGVVDLRTCLGVMAGNIVGRLLLSTRLFDWTTGAVNELYEIIHESNTIALSVLVGDFIPWLGWLDVITERRMRRSHKRLDKFFSGVLRERLREEGSRPERDFLGVLLAKTDRRDAQALDSIKSILAELFAAGIDTSSVALEWAMAELLRHPSEMKKLQAEIEASIEGNKKTLQESDTQQLNYMRLVIKEVLRLHPPAPLMLPHACNETKEVAGYSIPAGTGLWVNVWAIGRDESVWEKAGSFMPSRFEGSNLDLKGQHFDLLPFGSGRRRCPGMEFALPLMSLALANLIYTFDWELPPSQMPVPIDSDLPESFTGVLKLASPLCAVPKRRTVIP